MDGKLTWRDLSKQIKKNNPKLLWRDLSKNINNKSMGEFVSDAVNNAPYIKCIKIQTLLKPKKSKVTLKKISTDVIDL